MKELALTAFTKYYGKNKIPACEGIDFYADEGSITGLLGPNGAGKSTLLKTISGVQFASEGTLKVYDESDDAKIRNLCAYVPETPELNKKYTVKETLFLEAAMFESDSKKIQANIEKAVAVADLSEVYTKKISTLSKGFLQRTSLACAICKNPKVLILDEFSAGLDPSQTIKIRKEIKKLSSDKIIIFSTHHLEEAEALCNRLYILQNGKVQASGTIDEILKTTNQTTLEKAYIKLTDFKN